MADDTTLGHILHVLSLVDRPRNALATGVGNLLDDNPDTGFLGGAYQGLMGDKETSWGDIVGIPQPTSQDEWLPWLAKGGSRLALDAVADPLLLLGPISKAGKAGKLGTGVAEALDYLGKPYRAASEAVAGSSFGRAFQSLSPAHWQKDVDLPYYTAMREREQAVKPIVEAYQQGKPLEAGIEDMATTRQAWERNLGGIDPELNRFYGVMHDASEEARQRVNDVYRSLTGKDLIEAIGEGENLTWTPRAATKQARRFLDKAGLRGGGGAKIRPESFESRELKLLVDPDELAQGRIVPIERNGKPFVTKLDYELAGITKDSSGRYILQRGGEKIPVAPVEATLKEVLDSGLVHKKTWVPGVSESYLADILRKEGMRFFLSWLGKGITGGEKGPWLKAFEATDELPKGWRRLRITGLKNYGAPKFVANQIEKRSRKLFDKDTPMGMLEQFGDAALNTRIGELFKDGTTWWKRNALFSWSYLFGNAVSDIPLMYSAGVDSWLLPVRKAQAIAVRLGRGSPIFKNLSNRELRDEFVLRDLWTQGMAGAEGRDAVQAAINEGRIRRTLGDLPGLAGKAGRAAATGAEKWGKLNDFWLQSMSGNIEANSRIGVAIDWLKRNKIQSPTARDLDEAAFFANNKMIDYGNLPPFMKQVAMIVPFVAFQRGMLGRFAEDLGSSPERLARLSRFLDTTFEPMSASDRQISDDWIQENAPTMGAFGKSWDDIYSTFGQEPNPAGQRMGLAGRYLPWTQLDALASRPSDALISSTNPLLKAPVELATDYSHFKHRDIDNLTKFPGNLLNPIIGGPYQLSSSMPFGQNMAASWEHILSQMPGGTLMRQLSEVGRGLGLWKDLNRAETNPGEALTWYFSGGKVYPFDRAKQRMRRRAEADRYSRQILRNAQFAWSRNNVEAVQHYVNLLRTHQMDLDSAFGYVEG